jgi:hypothetical protein
MLEWLGRYGAVPLGVLIALGWVQSRHYGILDRPRHLALALAATAVILAIPAVRITRDRGYYAWLAGSSSALAKLVGAYALALAVAAYLWIPSINSYRPRATNIELGGEVVGKKSYRRSFRRRILFPRQELHVASKALDRVIRLRVSRRVYDSTPWLSEFHVQGHMGCLGLAYIERLKKPEPILSPTTTDAGAPAPARSRESIPP